MSQIMYDIPSDNSIVEVDITPESVRDGAEPQLIRDPNRPPRPHLGAAALRAQSGGLARPGRYSLRARQSNSMQLTGRRGKLLRPFPSTPARLRWNPSSSFR